MKTEQLLTRAKEIVLNDAIKGYTSQIFKETAENDPVEFAELVYEIGKQASEADSHKQAIDIYGQELCGLALAYRMRKDEEEKQVAESFIRKLLHSALIKL